MSLFQFEFSQIDHSAASTSTPQQPAIVPDHMPTLEESGHGAVQYEPLCTM